MQTVTETSRTVDYCRAKTYPRSVCAVASTVPRRTQDFEVVFNFPAPGTSHVKHTVPIPERCELNKDRNLQLFGIDGISLWR